MYTSRGSGKDEIVIIDTDTALDRTYDDRLRFKDRLGPDYLSLPTEVPLPNGWSSGGYSAGAVAGRLGRKQDHDDDDDAVEVDSVWDGISVNSGKKKKKKKKSTSGSVGDDMQPVQAAAHRQESKDEEDSWASFASAKKKAKRKKQKAGGAAKEPNVSQIIEEVTPPATKWSDTEAEAEPAPPDPPSIQRRPTVTMEEASPEDTNDG